MTLADMKKKVLSLIEELDTTVTDLTNDADIKAKLNYVINQIMFELSRVKKIPKYAEITVTADEVLEFSDIDSTNEIYQLACVQGVLNEIKANGTVIKCLESGTAEIEYFIYPATIDSSTANTYTFALSADVLECMPYGVAADLLKSDVSSAYGNVYAQRYEQMKQQIDVRYNTGYIEIEEGGL